jgi:hypothetical protein
MSLTTPFPKPQRIGLIEDFPVGGQTARYAKARHLQAQEFANYDSFVATRLHRQSDESCGGSSVAN